MIEFRSDMSITVSAILAVTEDGFIARNSEEFADWTSKEDKKHFVQITKEIGTVLMGSKTFQTILDGFGKPLPGRVHIILSRDPNKTYPYEGVYVMSGSPEEIVAQLEQNGFKRICICGGREVYSAFLEADLIDTIYQTVEPVYFGEGVGADNDDPATFQKRLRTKFQIKEMIRLPSGKNNHSTRFIEWVRKPNN